MQLFVLFSSNLRMSMPHTYVAFNVLDLRVSNSSAGNRLPKKTGNKAEIEGDSSFPE